jgi:hypothetical protein
MSRDLWPTDRWLVDDGYRSPPFPFEEITAPLLEIRAQWTHARVVGYVETVFGRAGAGASGGRV